MYEENASLQNELAMFERGMHQSNNNSLLNEQLMFNMDRFRAVDQMVE